MSLKTIAERTGMAPSTVSRVLRGDKGCYVSEENRKLISQISSELNYSPNFSARNLATGRTSHITFVLCKFLHLEAYGPFTYKTIDGIRSFLAEKGYILSIVTVPKDDIGEIKKLCSAGKFYDGVIFGSGVVTKNILDEIAKSDMPVAFIDDAAAHLRNFSTIQTDRRAGIIKGISYLKERGHSKIAFLGCGFPQFISFAKEAFKRGILKNGLKFNENLIYDFSSGDCNVYRESQYAYIAAEKMLKDIKKFTAIFCSNDFVALGLIERLKKNKMEVGKDVSVMGFDDIEELLEMPEEQRFLTTVRKPREEIGRSAAEVLIRQIESKEREVERKKLSCSLVIRKSVN